MSQQLSLNQIIACGLDRDYATAILPSINQRLKSLSAIECWRSFTQNLLTPNHPFALHELLYQTVFAGWDEGAPPAWFPSEEQIQPTHIAEMMNEVGCKTYAEFHTWSVEHRDEFWQRVIDRLGIRFREPYSTIVDLTNGLESPQWLVNARLNIVESCFQAPKHATAIVWQAESGAISTLTYAELEALTDRVANALVQFGFQIGDAIAIIMPMTIESVAIYLGMIKAGCVVVSIADSFSASEIATRLNITHAKAVFTQDCILRLGKRLPLYNKVIAANAPQAIVVTSSSLDELRHQDITWENFLSFSEPLHSPRFDAIPAHPDTPTNILFSSGTTGEPKAIPWTHTTPIKCAADAYLHHDIHPGDTIAWSTSLGWMMGPWLIYASLINRATLALYYGSPSDQGFGQFVQDARVTMLGVVPSLVNTWKTTACMQGLDWSAIKAFSSTGECSNPQDMFYLMSLAGYKPIIEYCGGTEIGGSYITGTLLQAATPATFTTPALGLDFILLDEDHQPADKGEVFLIPPSIGLSTTILNKDHHDVYFADVPFAPLRRHGDRLERLSNGYYRAHGRVDDTMNLSGIKVSAVEIEQCLNRVDGIAETAAIAVSPADGGPSQLIVYVVPVSEHGESPDNSPSDLLTPLQIALKQQLNPLFKIHALVVVEALPRTASNKMMRRLLRDRYQKTPTSQDILNRQSSKHYADNQAHQKVEELC
jgi:acetyl-CoA synthetase